MDNQQARFILRSYRAGGQDASDPIFKEALGQAQMDPDLARWFAGERVIDQMISAKLLSVPVPPDLKSMIFAGHKIAHRQSGRSWMTWLAVAATLVLFIGLGVFFRPRSSGALSYATLWNEVAQFAPTHFSLDLETKNLNEIHSWLASRGAPGDVTLPSGLAHLPAMGCRTMEVQGRKVALICFVTEKNEMVHLFVIQRDLLKDPPSEASTQFAQRGGWATASWSDRKKTYILAGKGNADSLKRFL